MWPEKPARFIGHDQNYPDYRKLLRRLDAIEEELRRLASLLEPFEDYFRETGFFPGLK